MGLHLFVHGWVREAQQRGQTAPTLDDSHDTRSTIHQVISILGDHSHEGPRERGCMLGSPSRSLTVETDYGGRMGRRLSHGAPGFVPHVVHLHRRLQAPRERQRAPAPGVHEGQEPQEVPPHPEGVEATGEPTVREHGNAAVLSLGVGPSWAGE